jgi:2-polyprenyl-3-methyl-5-hydroxy-6-metoxy-1,4-benzoquinol methylase
VLRALLQLGVSKEQFTTVLKWVKKEVKLYDPGLRAENKAKEVIGFLLPYKAPVMIDVGGGDGIITNIVSKKTNAVKAVIYDLKDKRDASVRNRVEYSNSSTYVKADIALLLQTFHHIQNKEKFAENLYNSMNQGGQVIVSDHAVSDDTLSSFLEHIHSVYEILNDDEHYSSYFISKEKAMEHFTNAGFSVIKVTKPKGGQRKYMMLLLKTEVDPYNFKMSQWDNYRTKLHENNIRLIYAPPVSGKTYIANKRSDIVDGDELISWPKVNKWWLKRDVVIRLTKEQFSTLMNLKFKKKTYVLWAPTDILYRLCDYAIAVSKEAYDRNALKREKANSTAKLQQGSFKDYNSYLKSIPADIELKMLTDINDLKI